MTTDAAVLPRSEVIGWRNAIFVVFALAGFAVASWLSRVPAVRDELAVSTSVLGFVLLGLAAGSMVGLTASSGVIERLGAARGLLVAVAASVAGLPIAAIGSSVGSPVLTFAGLAVFGFGNGMWDVAMNISGAANERALGRSVMPLFHAAFSLGTVIGVGAGSLAEALAVPVIVHVSIASALILVGALTATRWFRSERTAETHDEVRPDWRERLKVWGEPRTLLIGLLVLGMAFAEGSANDWLPLAMVDGHGLQNDQGAIVLGVFLAAMTIGRLGGVFLLDRFGRVPVLRTAAAFAVVGLALVIFGPTPAVAIIGSVIWGLGASLGFPVGMSAAADDARMASARVSVVATIGYLAFLGGPPLIGILGDQVGLLRALLVVVVLVVISGLVTGAAREPKPAVPKA
ncbi:MFS transporter [Naasia lichenicola]|uniref:MFS transporter n=1 Tax=Naasia lichenicola TaxID=2565933 RepID=A0A4S4FJL3_9MICO|nr:MFS transporter [Naasia lichenicola]THG29435.1 MFS transporter [Naasia lichenicola]